jgi:hypothetical protein
VSTATHPPQPTREISPLLAVQVCLFVVAAGLAALTALDRMPPALLLAFTFALGAG